jgi:short-subunit dehydrogenase
MNIIITGGTKGIGRAIADAFAAEGAHLAVCSRTASDLESMRTEYKTKFPACQLLTRPVDVSSKAQLLEFAEWILQDWEQIDALINNAGVFIPGEILKEESGKLETMMETNLYSAYHLTRAIAPRMIEQGKGHIFNICSIASLFAYPNGGSYSISKFAMLGFSKVLREELKEKGVRVTSVMPGATWSASWEGADLPQERLMPAEDDHSWGICKDGGRNTGDGTRGTEHGTRNTGDTEHGTRGTEHGGRNTGDGTRGTEHGGRTRRRTRGRNTGDGTRETEHGGTEHGGRNTGRNTEHGTRNTEHGTRGTEHGGRNTGDGTRGTEHGGRNTGDGTRNTEHGTRNTGDAARMLITYYFIN